MTLHLANTGQECGCGTFGHAWRNSSRINVCWFAETMPFDAFATFGVARRGNDGHDAFSAQFNHHGPLAVICAAWVSVRFILREPFANVVAMAARISAPAVNHFRFGKENICRHPCFAAINVNVANPAGLQDDSDSTRASERPLQMSQAQMELRPSLDGWVIFSWWNRYYSESAPNVGDCGFKKGRKQLLFLHFYSLFSFLLKSDIQRPFKFQQFKRKFSDWNSCIIHESCDVCGEFGTVPELERHTPPVAGRAGNFVSPAKEITNQIEVVALEGGRFFFHCIHFLEFLKRFRALAVGKTQLHSGSVPAHCSVRITDSKNIFCEAIKRLWRNHRCGPAYLPRLEKNDACLKRPPKVREWAFRMVWASTVFGNKSRLANHSHTAGMGSLCTPANVIASWL